MYSGSPSWSIAADVIGGGFAFVIFAYPSVFFHELGHLVAGKLMGLTPMYLVVGESDTLFRKRCFGVEIIVNLVPFCGFVVIKERRPNRFQQFVFILGGPFANLVLSVLALWLWRHTHFELTALALFFMQIGIAVANLIPRDVSVEGFLAPSDGKRLVSLFKVNEKG